MLLCDGIDKEVYSSRFNHAHIEMWPTAASMAEFEIKCERDVFSLSLATNVRHTADREH